MKKLQFLTFLGILALVMILEYGIISKMQYPFSDDFFRYLSLSEMINFHEGIPDKIHSTIDSPSYFNYPPGWYLLIVVLVDIMGLGSTPYVAINILAMIIPLMGTMIVYAISKCIDERYAMLSALFFGISTSSGVYFGLIYPSPATLGLVIFLLSVYLLFKSFDRDHMLIAFIGGLIFGISSFIHYIPFFVGTASILFMEIAAFYYQDYTEFVRQYRNAMTFLLTGIFISILCISMLHSIPRILPLSYNHLMLIVISLYIIGVCISLIGYWRLNLLLRIRDKVKQVFPYAFLGLIVFLMVSPAGKVIFPALYAVNPDIASTMKTGDYKKVTVSFWYALPFDLSSPNIPCTLRGILSNTILLLPQQLWGLIVWPLTLGPIVFSFAIISLWRIKLNNTKILYIASTTSILLFFIVTLLYGARLILFILPFISILAAIGLSNIVSSIKSGKARIMFLAVILIFIVLFHVYMNWHLSLDSWPTQSELAAVERIKANNYKIGLCARDWEGHYGLIYDKLGPDNFEYLNRYTDFPQTEYLFMSKSTERYFMNRNYFISKPKVYSTSSISVYRQSGVNHE